MAKRVETKTGIPYECQATEMVNCQVVGDSVVVVDAKARAEVVFKDSLGEYRAEFYPGWSWVYC